jgi:NAD kinase
MLNEIFLAEKDASKTSTYKVIENNIDLGRFKSSGIIVSTGTGSSGWLYGAKRVTYNVVNDIAKELKNINN